MTTYERQDMNLALTVACVLTGRRPVYVNSGTSESTDWSPAQRDVSLQARHAFSPNWTLSGGVRNATDEYHIVYNPVRRRTYFAGMEYSIL